MKTKAVRLYGKDDVRLEEFELPPIEDDEILVKIISDSICMSTYKTIKQGKKHKRVPDDVDQNPVIIGHEFSGEIVEVGRKWKDKFKVGDKFAQQPAIPGQMESPGYSYRYCGGDSEYCIFPNHIIEAGCLWIFEGDSFFASSLAEPVSCVIGGYHSNYHSVSGTYQHVMGTKKDGNILILGGCGPMGLAAISYGLSYKNKPKRIVVTDINDAKINRAKQVISEEEAQEHGIELIYVNIDNMENPIAELKKITDDHGYDDVFVYVPNEQVCELGNQVLAYDGCLNVFAGPIDKQFSAKMNLYDAHYSKTKIIGSTGGTIDDMKEAIDKERRHEINSAVMITHVGGLNSVVDTTSNLPNLPGGKKLVYTHIYMPMVAIEDFHQLGINDPFYAKLDELCQKHKGLWNSEAEQYLLQYFADNKKR